MAFILKLSEFPQNLTKQLNSQAFQMSSELDFDRFKLKFE